MNPLFPLLPSYTMNYPSDELRNIMYRVHRDIRSRKIHATHCNSGCIVCGSFLPSWWPMLCHKTANLSHIPESEVKTWLDNTASYIIDGCCSFKCYKDTPGRLRGQNTSLKEGQVLHLYCRAPYCDEYIRPIDAAVFQTKFCSPSCVEDDRSEREEYFRDMAMCE